MKPVVFTSHYRNLRFYMWYGHAIRAAQFRNGRFVARSPKMAAAVAWAAATQPKAGVFVRGMA